MVLLRKSGLLSYSDIGVVIVLSGPAWDHSIRRN